MADGGLVKKRAEKPRRLFRILDMLGIGKAGAALNAHRRARLRYGREWLRAARSRRAMGARFLAIHALLKGGMAIDLQIAETPADKNKKDERQETSSSKDASFESRLKPYPMRRDRAAPWKILFGESFQMAGRFVLMDLHLQPPIFIGQPVGLQPHDFQLAVEALRLHVFPNAKHENAEACRADFGPLANGFTIGTVSHNFSKTLNLALRDRGFSCISVSDATITFRLRRTAHGAWPQTHCGILGGQIQPLAA